MSIDELFSLSLDICTANEILWAAFCNYLILFLIIYKSKYLLLDYIIDLTQLWGDYSLKEELVYVIL